MHVLPGEEAVGKLSAKLREESVSEITLTHTMGEIEELLGKEYLAIDGAQKVYVLPENVDVEELLGNLKGLRTGEIKQSQMWRRTDIQIGNTEDKEVIMSMDKRITRLESLLNQMIGQDIKGK